MRTRGSSTASALAASALLVAGCSDGPASRNEGAGPRPTEKALAQIVRAPDVRPAEDCLLVVWQEQKNPDASFDRAHDAADGGAISCATGTTASEFEAAIETLRDAAKSGDRAALLKQVGMPLLFIDGRGDRREITDPAAIDATFDTVFDDRMLALLQRLDLSQLTVVPDRGAFFELGSLWLVVDRKGGRPRLVTVNHQALGEAAAATRRAAGDGSRRSL